MTKRKITRSTLLIGAIIILLTTLAIFKLLNRNRVPTVAEVTSVAGSCGVTFSLNRPSPSPIASPLSSPTPATPSASTFITSSPSVCDISFDLPDQAVCWKDAKTVDITYTVNSLPPGGPYYVITDWFNASPIISENNYFLDESIPLEVGKTYSMQAEWPGVTPGFKGTVEIHAGLQVVPNKYELLQPNCTSGIDYYWTPFVCPI